MSSETLLKKLAHLKTARYRQKYGQFTVEGRKAVDELIHSNYKVHNILATKEFTEKNPDVPVNGIISDSDMAGISGFATPPGILALAEMKQFNASDLDLNVPITLCLDGISDPGNLGTIIRTADWFGVNQVLMSHNCTDFYNPKSLSATMGSFTRCTFVYTDLGVFLAGRNAVGCFLDGEDIYKFKPDFPMYLVIGSESQGISGPVAKYTDNRITIPGYGRAESLNAGVAAGIVLEKFSHLAFGKK